MSAPAPARGHGGAWGAISFLNAIPAGVGCAAAVSLPVTVEAEYSVPPTDAAPTLTVTTGPSTPLLVKSIERALRAVRAPASYTVRLAVNSSLPHSKGLKSSSAVSVAVTRAIFAALRHAGEPSEVATLSAKAALEAGASVTGAFDDALASALGGVVVADVRAHWQLQASELPNDLVAVLWIPAKVHAPTGMIQEALGGEAVAAKEAIRLAMRGDYLRAMERNTLVVERALGYDYASLREKGKAQGAQAAGVSGNGPTLAFVVPQARAAAVAAALPTTDAQVLTVRFVGHGAPSP